MGAVASLVRFSYAYPAWAEPTDPVLREVDLTLGPGVTLVAGDSGAGKSTLLRVLNGLVPHFHGGRVRGQASVCGMDILETPTRRLARQVGFVFQEPDAGFVRATAAREVAFGPENLGLDRPVVQRLVADAMEHAGITALAARRLRTLSGGERQRVALAAALAADPMVVVMDEPASQLDEDGATALAATVHRLAAGGRTVVVAEHRLARLAAGARILVVEDGSVRDVATAVAAADRARAVAAADRATAVAARAPGGPTAWALHDATVAVGGRVLFEDLDLAGAAGEIVLVTGPNGSGKTTLLRTVAGLLPVLSGRVERRPGRVAYLPQDPGVLLHRQSVRAEIAQTLKWTGAGGGVEPVLRLLGLSGLADHDPRDLSVGQRQRAALGAVLAGHPAIALLDEPTRGMDGAARRSLAAALTELADGGAAVLLATHDLELARDLPGRVLRIEHGLVRPDAAERVQ